ncbi:MAG: hypothetical protein WC546_06110 [Candidatus Omnitrophota bacterium]
MADWKNNKVLGVVAGIAGIVLIVFAASMVLRMLAPVKQVPAPKVELSK